MLILHGRLKENGSFFKSVGRYLRTPFLVPSVKGV